METRGPFTGLAKQRPGAAACSAKPYLPSIQDGDLDERQL
jgi:hypothetical protein